MRLWRSLSLAFVMPMFGSPLALRLLASQSDYTNPMFHLDEAEAASSVVERVQMNDFRVDAEGEIVKVGLWNVVVVVVVDYSVIILLFLLSHAIASVISHTIAFFFSKN